MHDDENDFFLNTLFYLSENNEIDKDKMFLVMSEINKTIIKERLGIGDIIIPNVLNTGANIILTSNALKEEIYGK